MVRGRPFHEVIRNQPADAALLEVGRKRGGAAITNPVHNSTRSATPTAVWLGLRDAILAMQAARRIWMHIVRAESSGPVCITAVGLSGFPVSELVVSIVSARPAWPE